MDSVIGRRSGADPALTILAILATLLGILAIWDSGYARAAVNGQILPREFWMQGVFAFASVGFCFAVYKIPGKWLKKLGVLGMLLTVVLLFLVEVPGIGAEINGAQRWIDLKLFMLQPAEFAKLACILYLAAALADRPSHPKRTRSPRHPGEWLDWHLIPFIRRAFPLLVVGFIIVMIEQEPDLATAMVIAFATFVMLLVGGVSWRSLAILALVSGLLVTALTIKEPYRMARITNHAERWSDANIDGPGYQTTQSEAALARGGLLGVGLGNGRAKHTLPAPTTDFILATIGEEFGLIGSLVVVGLIAGIALRMAALGIRRKDPFGRLVLMGMASWIGIQGATNIMMANGFFPPIGIPLPFFSYGGSSLLALWMGVGLVQNVLTDRVPKKEVALETGRHGRRDRWSRLPSA